MVVFSRSIAPTRIQQILRTTATYFSLHALDPQLCLDLGEFIDPLPLLWRNASGPPTHAGSLLSSGIEFCQVSL